MKINLAYPKIPDTKNCPLKKCVVFSKLDGTNIHIVYRNGYCEEFGTRRDRFSGCPKGRAEFIIAHPELSTVISGDHDYLNCLDHKIRMEEKYASAKECILFFEYVGENSFAGSHQPDDIKRLFIIDVQIDGKILPPEEFLKDFKDFYPPKVVYRGKYSGQLVEDIRNGKYPVKEGCIIKGLNERGEVYMAKVKTNAYMEKLKQTFKDNWSDFWE